MPTITASARERIKRFQDRVARILMEVDPDLPSYIVHAPSTTIDDECGYDQGWDTRPDFVRDDDAAWQRKG